MILQIALDSVDDVRTLIVSLAGVSFGVTVRKIGTHNLTYCIGDNILAGNKIDGPHPPLVLLSYRFEYISYIHLEHTQSLFDSVVTNEKHPCSEQGFKCCYTLFPYGLAKTACEGAVTTSFQRLLKRGFILFDTVSLFYGCSKGGFRRRYVNIKGYLHRI